MQLPRPKVLGLIKDRTESEPRASSLCAWVYYSSALFIPFGSLSLANWSMSTETDRRCVIWKFSSFQHSSHYDKPQWHSPDLRVTLETRRTDTKELTSVALSTTHCKLNNHTHYISPKALPLGFTTATGEEVEKNRQHTTQALKPTRPGLKSWLAHLLPLRSWPQARHLSDGSKNTQLSSSVTECPAHSRYSTNSFPTPKTRPPRSEKRGRRNASWDGGLWGHGKWRRAHAWTPCLHKQWNCPFSPDIDLPHKNIYRVWLRCCAESPRVQNKCKCPVVLSCATQADRKNTKEQMTTFKSLHTMVP